MKTITSEHVENTWTRMAEMSLDQAQKFAFQMAEEQPHILEYLAASGEAYEFNNDENELLVYLGIVVWQMMCSNDKLPKIEPDSIIDVEEKNLSMIDYLSIEDEKSFDDIVIEIFEKHNQPEILKYLLEALLEEEDEDCDIRDEMKGALFHCLKTVVEVVDLHD